MMSAELDQVICSGPRRGKQFTYALLEERAAKARRAAARRGARRADPPLLHQPRAGDAARLRLVVGPDDGRCEAGRGDRRTRAGAGDVWRARRTGPLAPAPEFTGAPAERRQSSAYLLPIYDEYLIAYKDRRARWPIPPPPGPSATIDGYAHWLIVDGRFVGTWRRVDTHGRRRGRPDAAPIADGRRHAGGGGGRHRYSAFLGLPVVVRGLAGNSAMKRAMGVAGPGAARGPGREGGAGDDCARPAVIGYLFPQDRLLDPAQHRRRQVHPHQLRVCEPPGRAGRRRLRARRRQLRRARRGTAIAPAPEGAGVGRRMDLVEGIFRRGAHAGEAPAVRRKRSHLRPAARPRRVRRGLGIPRSSRRRQHAPAGRQGQFHRRDVGLAVGARQRRRRARAHDPAHLCRRRVSRVHRQHRDGEGAGVGGLREPDDVRLQGRLGGCIAGHHANLYDHPSDDKKRSADRAVREFLAAGVPAAKLVMGVPFYGRGWREVNPVADGLYQPGMAVEADNLAYGRLAAEVVGRDGFARTWDATSHRRRFSGTPTGASSSATTTPSRCD